MNALESKIKELQSFLDLSLNYVPMAIKTLSINGWSDDEIIIIIDHFMNGGMISEILAPAKSADTRKAILASTEALKAFDLFFDIKVAEVPGLKDKLFLIWVKKQSNTTENL